MNEIYCDPSKRHDFVYLFDVSDGNPNGDPDAGNMPRVDPESMRGIVTDVCIKRKVRDYIGGVLGRKIFIQSETALNTLVEKAIRSAKDEHDKPIGQPCEVKLAGVAEMSKLLEAEDEELIAFFDGLDEQLFAFDSDAKTLTYNGEERTKPRIRMELTGDQVVPDSLKPAVDALVDALFAAKKKGTIDAKGRVIVKDDLCRAYFDIRMFGAVLTAGTNFGQVRGPMQLTFAQSVDPVHPRDLSITRIAITKDSDRARKSTEMGRKAIVPYGLYRLHGFFNPLLARDTGVTGEDLKDFWDALKDLFTFDRSAARGEMRVRGLYVFTHDSGRGNAQAHRLFEHVSVPACGKPAATFEDYRVGISAPKPGPVESYSGVTLNVLASEPKSIAAQV